MTRGGDDIKAAGLAALRELCVCFLADPRETERCAPLRAEDLPEPFGRLLNHRDHMTTTLGDFYGVPVELRVLAERHDGDFYARKILLHLPGGASVVEFGIVRINMPHMPPPVRDEIFSRRKPLGDILIEHDLLREVEPLWFWRLPADGEIADSFASDRSLTPYARVGRIRVNGSAAIELVEAVVDARPAGRELLNRE